MKILFILLILSISTVSYSQSVVQWFFFAKKISDNMYEVHLLASIDEGWHIYSQTTPKEGPSLPTEISFKRNPIISLQGQLKEIGKMVTKHEQILDVDLKYYQNKVDFVQVVKLKSNAKTLISGSIEFMACTDKQCLLPEIVKFSIPIGD